ncbi:hypothetical protein FGIG_10212 [Fasciola gigantica]|uniref:Right handed beta helix domain-containing protein n=1 Tax=Fasciola gigantica TaxID=46835 RepID=A0A504Y823_FASGI|nr:hypothetical protein FGIG_10212 [Fasciola gigantica]
MGQTVFLADRDARLPVTFLNAAELFSSSYLISNMFENSLSTAISAFGTSGLIIQDTVIYKTKGSGIALKGSGHQLLHNVIIQTGWSGSSASGTTLSSPDIVFQAGINIQDAPDTILYDFTVVGAQRICLVAKGLDCSENLDTYWRDVVLHSCMIGLVVTDANPPCTIASNIKVYSTTEFSVYWRVLSSILGTNMQLVDNRGDTTVAKFGINCSDKPDVFWRTDTANEDGIQPSYFEGITTIDLNPEYIVYYDRPKLSHSECSSPECVKRLSSFVAFVARNKNFLLYFPGTPPQNIRLSILQPDSTYGVRVGIDYPVSGRLEVYADGKHVLPLNGAYNGKNEHVTQLGGASNPWLYNLIDSQGSDKFRPVQNALFSVSDGGYSIVRNQNVTQPGTVNLTSTIADPNFIMVLVSNITFTVAPRKFHFNATLVNTVDSPDAVTGKNVKIVTFRILMYDNSTGKLSEYLDWRNFTWQLVAGLYSEIRSSSVVGINVNTTRADYFWNTSAPVVGGEYTYCFRLNAYANTESNSPLSEYTPSQVSMAYKVTSVTTTTTATTTATTTTITMTETTFVTVIRLTFAGTLASISSVLDEFNEAIKTKILALCPSVTVSNVAVSEVRNWIGFTVWRILPPGLRINLHGAHSMVDDLSNTQCLVQRGPVDKIVIVHAL